MKRKAFNYIFPPSKRSAPYAMDSYDTKQFRKINISGFCSPSQNLIFICPFLDRCLVFKVINKNLFSSAYAMSQGCNEDWSLGLQKFR